jgi:cobalt-zinc-cadmium efflux system membrane fusion protein
MKHKIFLPTTLFLGLSLVLLGCGQGKADPKAEAPPPTQVVRAADVNLIKVEHPDQFPLATAGEHKAAPALNVTGTVNPDITRNVPAISLATGRVVEIKARLGDVVKKGQLLLRVQSNDISGAFQQYLKTVNDERLARTQLERAQILFEKGAISQKDLQVAQAAEQDARVDLDAATQQLKLLGVDKDHPTGIVDIVAPISGVIVEQNVTNAAGVQGLSSPNPFTISDLSHVWIICDVYENDLDAIHLGQFADIHLNAYPGKTLKGRIDNIGPILDPSIRAAKVRLEVPNPNEIMRVGMFVTATFYGKQPETYAVVPAASILHLHDRDWVYVPADGGGFRRVEVKGGNMLPNGMQEIRSGVTPGAKVVSNALELQNTVDQ